MNVLKDRNTFGNTTAFGWKGIPVKTNAGLNRRRYQETHDQRHSLLMLKPNHCCLASSLQSFLSCLDVTSKSEMKTEPPSSKQEFMEVTPAVMVIRDLIDFLEKENCKFTLVGG